MIVSQFNIRNSPNLEVMTSYELMLTNLEDKGYHFKLSVQTDEFNFHTKATFNITAANSYSIVTLEPTGNDRYQTTKNIFVAPDETVRIQLMPFDLAKFEPTKEFEDAFGYIDLSIPLTWTWGSSSKKEQGKDPVRVLLHAYAVDWKAGAGRRDYAPITISSGKADNEIIPDSLYRFTWTAYEKAHLLEYMDANQAMINDLVADDRNAAAAMLYLFSNAAEHEEHLGHINRLLAEVELPFEVSRRKG